MFTPLRHIVALTLLALLLAACGGAKTAPTAEKAPAATSAPAPTATPAPTPTATPVSDLNIDEVVFTHGLDDDMTPTDKAESFTPEQTVYVSVKLDGNPKKGVVAADFSFNEQHFADAQVDMASARDDQGVIFSFGGNTYVGFTLSHKDPLPISTNYRVALSLDGEPAGEYSFHIIPPEDAIPSRLISATLATDAKAETYEPINPTDTFSPDEQVVLAGRLDLGRLSTLMAEWRIDGEVDDTGTRTITASENVQDTPFYFTYLPEKGWPAGKHQIILSIDDEPVGTYEFTIKPAQ